MSRIPWEKIAHVNALVWLLLAYVVGIAFLAWSRNRSSDRAIVHATAFVCVLKGDTARCETAAPHK